jgi:DNA polymerase-4/protein ImuB
MLRRLRLFGIRRLGDLVKLPLSAVQAQFGPEGRRAWDLANGVDDEPLRAIDYPVEMSDTFTFEQPVIVIDAILIITRQLVERMVRSKRFGYRAARGLHFQAKMTNGQVWERTATFREPTTDSRQMLLALLGKLNSFVPAAPIEALRITLTDLCAEGGTQVRLPISEKVTHLEPLRDAIDQLRSRLGFNPIAKIVEVEPWSRIPERRLALMTYDL